MVSSRPAARIPGSSHTEKTAQRPPAPESNPSSSFLPDPGDPKGPRTSMAGNDAADGKGEHPPHAPSERLLFQPFQKLQGKALHIKQDHLLLLRPALPSAFGASGISAIMLNIVINPTPTSPRSHTNLYAAKPPIKSIMSARILYNV